jgi:lipopolysaccharide/colanic/teichoic acid biosynthesis glycosyltransferase/glycosyltransferase involved in cell wall biosynthesis
MEPSTLRTPDHRTPVLLHVTTVPQSLGFLRQQVRYMRSKGLDVHVLSSPGESLERFAAEQQVVAHAVSMSRRITPWRDLVALWRLVRVLRRVRPHIVHGHTPKGGLLAMIAAWWCGVPVRIYHIHGLPLMTAAGLWRRLLRWTEKTACFFARGVLCVSTSVREVAIAERLCPEDKIRVLLNGSIDGVDAGRFDRTQLPAATRMRIREEQNIPPDAIVLGFVGRIVRDKGFVELAEAWRRLREERPDIHLLLVGAAEPQDPIPADVEVSLRDDPRVHRAGVVRDMPRLYAAMDVVVLPTYREGFPVVPLEAAAMELPVVATRIPGCVDAIEEGVTGTLVPPRDVSALSEALRRYLHNPALRSRHGREGRQRVVRDFRPAEMSRAVFEEYDRLLGSAAVSAAPCGRDAHAPRSIFYRRHGKRLLDLALTLPALVLLAPLVLAIAVLVRLTLGAPVLFRQRRSGRHGEPFTIIKFRTMIEARDSSGRRGPDVQRLTRLGRFLRATSLDELPELYNVLTGEMSLVGPRPLIVRYLPWYTPRERRRFDVLPGITGWAQINGRNTLNWDDRLALDVGYVESCRLGLDLKILFVTIWKVLRRTDVHVDSARVLRSLDEERCCRDAEIADLSRTPVPSSDDGRTRNLHDGAASPAEDRSGV